jgi:hypothetical protein
MKERLLTLGVTVVFSLLFGTSAAGQAVSEKSSQLVIALHSKLILIGNLEFISETPKLQYTTSPATVDQMLIYRNERPLKGHLSNRYVIVGVEVPAESPDFLAPLISLNNRNILLLGPSFPPQRCVVLFPDNQLRRISEKLRKAISQTPCYFVSSKAILEFSQNEENAVIRLLR